MNKEGKKVIKKVILSFFLVGFFIGCGPKERATDEIKKKVDSLDQEIMEQLEEDKKDTNKEEKSGNSR